MPKPNRAQRSSRPPAAKAKVRTPAAAAARPARRGARRAPAGRPFSVDTSAARHTLVQLKRYERP